MPLLNKFLWKFSLRTGVIVAVTYSFVVVISDYIMVLLDFYGIQKAFYDNSSDVYAHISMVFAIVIEFGAALMLLFGALKKKQWLILPWLSYVLPNLAFFILGTVAACAHIHDSEDAWVIVFFCILSGVGVLVWLYLWIIVFSFLQALDKGSLE